MIAKISTGADPKGLAAYLHGPGKETPHTYRDEAGRLFTGGQVIAGTVQVTARNPQRWGRDFERAAKTNARVSKPIWHCSLRCAPGDRRLTDAEFADIAQLVAERMGYETHPWVAVRHDDDHIHLALCRVDFEGRTWKNRHDRWRVVEVMREVEQRFGLVRVPVPARGQGRQLSTGEQRMAMESGVVAAKMQLRELVAAARDVSAGGGLEAFEAALTSNPVAPVQVRRNEASTGRMNGYSFHLSGHVDAEGTPVWFSASQLDRKLSWKQLSAVLDGPVPDRRVPAHELPKKRLERAVNWEKRRQQVGQEQFAAQRWQQVRNRLVQEVTALRGPSGGEQKWRKVRHERDEQQRMEDQRRRDTEAAIDAFSRPQPQPRRQPQDSQVEVAPEVLAAVEAAMQSSPRSVTQQMRDQEQNKAAAKREYAIAKAKAEREARAKDAAKWAEIPGGGWRRDVAGIDLRMWVSDEGQWSVTSKTDPTKVFRQGESASAAAGQAAAAAAAKILVEGMWENTRSEKRTPQLESVVRAARADLTPTRPAKEPSPARSDRHRPPHRPPTPPTFPGHEPERGRGYEL
ncbi:MULTISPECIES: relaxase/mobilization nuclease domain-containing protein [unclassified Rhodococcus (in: high G+C Gram-positive bacteria)]|uniref:relaxase/mobilization nuclease domain-containing protein n=1 Tax=unclassified Rhodococcus (in: high G+C Gram-positive bacteria) TaxID=192944 RepID=UPI001C7DB599|nr:MULTISPECIES: relaxase/mobilization nuclease domain-containing protein [unclassified Rhodococcus (in: high G+C Gram-positive bacteria)]MBX4171924.1 relaxase/mobilization nuclease domain-containing protein [Rhodococcus sp. DMU2021]BDB63556.1 hypothetical protein RDE2_53500 [Rhodococcus sp. RDE2]